MLSAIGMLVDGYVLMQAFEQMGRARSNSSVIVATVTVWAATRATYESSPRGRGAAGSWQGHLPVNHPATWLLLAVVVFIVPTVAAALGLHRISEAAPTQELTETKAA